MRLLSFWAKGFRSLADVKLEPLGPFNVFYGTNGSGKSNVLAAIRVFHSILRVALRSGKQQFSIAEQDCELGVEDFARRSFVDLEVGAELQLVPGTNLAASFAVHRDGPSLRVSPRLEGNTQTHNVQPIDQGRAFHLVDAIRAISRDREGWNEPGDPNDPVAQLRVGRIAKGLFLAKTGPDSRQRRRLEALQALLAGPPLGRPAFEAVRNPHPISYELRERLPEPNPDGAEVRLDLAGLGIVQLYSVLAQAMLSDARIVGIEEPEAHLHAPTSGRQLRELLVRLVDEAHIDQLFIATHSNLFDLDEDGYWDFSLDADGHTRVERKPLDAIDARHLYEPGPAKHALIELLRYAPPEHVVFRRADGTAVTAPEMLYLLQHDDDVAVEFLRAVHGAAVRVVGLAPRDTHHP